MLAKPYRLKNHRDVVRVYSKGHGARVSDLSIKVASNKLESNRLTVVVSKKVAKSAPVRNRIRRRVYEYYRTTWDTLLPGHDIIVSVFDASIANLPAQELATRLEELVTRAGLVKNTAKN